MEFLAKYIFFPRQNFNNIDDRFSPTAHSVSRRSVPVTYLLYNMGIYVVEFIILRFNSFIKDFYEKVDDPLSAKELRILVVAQLLEFFYKLL